MDSQIGNSERVDIPAPGMDTMAAASGSNGIAGSSGGAGTLRAGSSTPSFVRTREELTSHRTVSEPPRSRPRFA
eukprot:4440787-Karenia_brevis.AAC.1